MLQSIDLLFKQMRNMKCEVSLSGQLGEFLSSNYIHMHANIECIHLHIVWLGRKLCWKQPTWVPMFTSNGPGLCVCYYYFYYYFYNFHFFINIVISVVYLCTCKYRLQPPIDESHTSSFAHFMDRYVEFTHLFRTLFYYKELAIPFINNCC